MKKIFIAICSLFAISTSMAQSTGELLKFSQYDFGGITARSAGMGGAFTSLGADLSSFSINPAGLAMYSSTEFAFTFGGNIGSTRSDYGGYNSDTKSQFALTLPNVGAAFKIGNLTLGVAYNTLANYNSSMSAVGDYETFNTSARIWADQLDGISSNIMGNTSTAFAQNPMLWNAAMGYQSYVLDPAYDGASSYGTWGIIEPTDAIQSAVAIQTKGVMAETAFSGAYNIQDFLYIGGSIGFQNLYYEQSSVYSEYSDLSIVSGSFDDFHIYDNLYLEGFGVNFKVGATLRPAPWIRIGVAYHSPTWMKIKELSNSVMISNFEYDSYSFDPKYDHVNDYLIQTADRLLLGASINLSNFGIFSIDYERAWYGSMKYNSTINTVGWRPGVLSDDIDNFPTYSDYTSSRGDIDMNSMISNYYQDVNTIKLGLEITPANGVFLRAGYGYSSSPYANTRSNYATSVSRSDYGAITRFSAGFGYRTGRFNFDLAYTYASWKSLPTKFFDYVTSYEYSWVDADNITTTIPAGTEISSFQNINQKNYSHNIMITLGWRL